MQNTEQKLKPFNLERALAGDPIIHNGDIAKYIFTNKCGGVLTHVFQGYYKNSENQFVISFNEHIGWMSGFEERHLPGSIFMAPLEKIGYMKIFPHATGSVMANTSVIFETKSGAENSYYLNRKDGIVVQVKWPE